MKPFFTLLIGLFSITLWSQSFTTTWFTTTSGQSITIPTFPGETYNYSINWGDGVSQAGVTGDVSHVYANRGSHTVTISGTFPRIYFNNTAVSRDMITAINSWGNIQWSSMGGAFYGCTQLTIPAANAPDLSNVTDMSNMFRNASVFNQDISHWNVSNVTNMARLFNNATAFNQPLNQWDVSNVTNMANMFDGATTFNQKLGDWDISNVTNMTNMLNGATLSSVNYDNTLIGWATLDAGETQIPIGITFSGGNSTFCNAVSARNALTMIHRWFVTDGGQDCTNAAFITTWRTNNQGISNDDQITIQTTGAGYNYTVDWGDGTSDTGVMGDIVHTYPAPGVYTVSITGDFPRIFFNFQRDISKILTIEQWGSIAWNSMGAAFHGCSNLSITATDSPDLSRVTTMRNMFNGALVLNQNINHWDVSNVTDMGNLFNDVRSFNQPLNNWDVSNVTNMSNMFNGATAFNQPLNTWDVSNVINMNGMFLNARSFNQPLNDWNMSNVTNMFQMFTGASAFNQSLNSWDVSNVTNMVRLFTNATVFDQPLNQWNVSNVTNMDGMFAGTVLFNQPLDNWDVSRVTNMREMFAGASAFNQDLATWDISSVTTMSNMFENASLSTVNYDNTLIGWATLDAGETRIPSNILFSGGNSNFCIGINARTELINTHSWSIIDAGQDCSEAFIATWQTANANQIITVPTTGSGYNYSVNWGDGQLDTGVTGNIQHTYTNAGTYTVIITGDFPRIFFNNANNRNRIRTIEQWGTNAWTSMRSAFYGCNNLTITATDTPNLSNVTNMSQMFRDASSLNQDISGWDVSNVTNIQEMFRGASTFNQPLDNWDVSNVTNMNGVFLGASAFNQPLNQWNVSNVITMVNMFFNASAFNQPLDQWNVSNVTNMQSMFTNASIFSQPLNNWDVSNVTTMLGMFSGASVFNQPLDNWNVSNVVRMDNMFDSASAFNQPLNNWNVGNVIGMTNMFDNASAFNQPLDSWDVSSVTDMGFMFTRASTFNQPLNNWDVSNVINMIEMFFGASAFNQPLDNWDVSNVTLMNSMFRSATAFDQSLSQWDISNVLTMSVMFDNIGLSTANYDSTLIGWATLDAGETQIPTNITFSGGNSLFCDLGEVARNTLINTFGWTITDGGKDSSTNCATLSTDDVALAEIILYPNPTVSNLIIDNAQNSNLERARIYDVNGRLIYETDLQPNTKSQRIDVSRLTVAIYFLRLDSDISSTTLRFVKQ